MTVDILVVRTCLLIHRSRPLDFLSCEGEVEKLFKLRSVKSVFALLSGGIYTKYEHSPDMFLANQIARLQLENVAVEVKSTLQLEGELIQTK